MPVPQPVQQQYVRPAAYPGAPPIYGGVAPPIYGQQVMYGGGMYQPQMQRPMYGGGVSVNVNVTVG